MLDIGFTIPLDPRTKKNNGRLARRNGRASSCRQKEFCDYQDKCGCRVKALFYMKTHRIVDLVGLLQALDDILVHYGVLADDNSRIIVSHDGSRVLYDKDNPRTEVYITEVEV